MNKDKLIQQIDDELEHHIAVKINASSLTVSTYHEGAIFGLKLAKQFIDSELEETCTYTKEQVAELILEYALDLENSKNFAIDMDTDDVIYWLNQKAGE